MLRPCRASFPRTRSSQGGGSRQKGSRDLGGSGGWKKRQGRHFNFNPQIPRAPKQLPWANTWDSRRIIKPPSKIQQENFTFCETVDHTALNTPCTKPGPRDHSSLPQNERTKKRRAIISFTLIGRNVARARWSLLPNPDLISLLLYSVKCATSSHKGTRFSRCAMASHWLHAGFHTCNTRPAAQGRDRSSLSWDPRTWVTLIRSRSSELPFSCH